MSKSTPRRDSQLSGLSGEFFVAAELLRREYQVSLTIGNAKSIDLFVSSPRTNRSIGVQVKTVRTPNAFIISPSAISKECIYAFVVLNHPDKGPPTYYILHGREMLANPNKYWPKPDEKLPGTAPKYLSPHKDAWSVFKSALDDPPSTVDPLPKATQAPQ